ncbi:ras-related protein Rab-13 isoform X3 [Ursus maritimus]|uniref:Ras-related protein Rab-13 isoform X3 n=1 Tax=Ursus maritimus TaxID=29073 RepID=A0A8M1G7L4_URSMA|nr:ras-related protein Rab-13 isoform X3 [Ursus maritimus]
MCVVCPCVYMCVPVLGPVGLQDTSFSRRPPGGRPTPQAAGAPGRPAAFPGSWAGPERREPRSPEVPRRRPHLSGPGVPWLSPSLCVRHGQSLRPPLQVAAHRGLGGGQDLSDHSLCRGQLQQHLHLHHRVCTALLGIDFKIRTVDVEGKKIKLQVCPTLLQELNS